MNRRHPILCVPLFLVSCAAAPKTTETLTEDLTRYHEGLRWKRYEDAAHHLPPDRREAFLDEREELAKEISIDEYEIQRIKVSKRREQAEVRVELTWHSESVGLVKKTVVRQRWGRVRGLWTLLEESRATGEPMPGVAEPKKDPTPDHPHDPSVGKNPSDTEDLAQ